MMYNNIVSFRYSFYAADEQVPGDRLQCGLFTPVSAGACMSQAHHARSRRVLLSSGA